VKSQFLLLFISISLSLQAQKSGQRDLEIGLSGGVSWYNGDLNPDKFYQTQYLHQAFALSVRKNINQRFAWRNSITKGILSADDKFSTSEFRKNRNLNFSTDIYEIASCIEFNFLQYDALLNKMRFSPYSFIGLGMFYFNPETDVEGNVYQLRPLSTEGNSYRRISVSMPFGMGIKWVISDRIIASADWGMRKTFTDYIDDVSTSYPLSNEISGLAANVSDRSLKQAGLDGTNWGTQRGNSKSKDWYSFSMVTLGVRLGAKKGSCKQLGF